MALAKRKRVPAIDQRMCRCIGPSRARAEAFGYRRRFESSGVFLVPESCSSFKNPWVATHKLT
jgi:hypothetical protein